MAWRGRGCWLDGIGVGVDLENYDRLCEYDYEFTAWGSNSQWQAWSTWCEYLEASYLYEPIASSKSKSRSMLVLCITDEWSSVVSLM
jgi:hypothetical protein